MNIDAYNPAIAYLKEKRGIKEEITNVRGGIIRSETYNLEGYSNWSYDDQRVHLLLSQYYLGIEPKKELYSALCDMGVMQLVD